MVSSGKFLWPQENRKLMQERIQSRPSSSRPLWRKVHQSIEDIVLVVRCLKAFFGFGDFKKIEDEMMYLFNGPHTDKFADKYQFLKLCSELGYRIPRQILITKNESLTERRRIFEKSFTDDGYGFYVKPVGGYAGKGIRVLKTRAEVSSILGEISEDCVIEETINIDKEIRYVLYVDPDGNKWHMSFEKIRPVVVGNGKSSVGKLILKDKEIPFRRKLILFNKKLNLLGRILSKGESLQLENIGTYGELPSEIEIDALDKFVPVFISDLERNIGHKLPILCFDLGITAPLKKNLTFEELRKIITPFECQMPFSPLAHFKFMPNGFGPFVDFYRMLIVDMMDTVNERLDKEKH